MIYSRWKKNVSSVRGWAIVLSGNKTIKMVMSYFVSREKREIKKA